MLKDKLCWYSSFAQSARGRTREMLKASGFALPLPPPTYIRDSNTAMSQAPLTGQPRLWTSHSTGPGMANSALADGHARQTLQLAQSGGLILLRALADGHARCSKPEDSPAFAAHQDAKGEARLLHDQPATGPEDKLFSWHSPKDSSC